MKQRKDVTSKPLTSIHDCLTLHNGLAIPCMGFGTYKTTPDGTSRILKTAIDQGHRYFDTASFYANEPLVGEAIADSGLPREAFFIASKVWRTEMGYDKTLEAFENSLRRLRTDYLDLYLMHWPRPDLVDPHWRELGAETWRAMEDLYLAGRVRAIGVCNFLPHHLEPLLEGCRIVPMVDQIEFHPGYPNLATVRYCQERGIMVQAWWPFCRGRIFGDPLIQKLCAKYDATPAQICLRYALQKGVIPLPKSSTPERMRENQNVFLFEMSEEDMYRIDSLPQIGWSGEHPDREKIPQV